MFHKINRHCYAALLRLGQSTVAADFDHMVYSSFRLARNSFFSTFLEGDFMQVGVHCIY